ncbi:MAG: M20 metallopeptidase family protein [Bacillota bacterium]
MIKIENGLLSIKDEVFKIAQELHQIPESGFEEIKTGHYIIEQLKHFGIEVHEGVAQTGIIGYLKGRKGEKTIGFRADMDALSVVEKTNLGYASKHQGMMHACGHDAHMTILLGLARYLSQNREKLTDNIVFLFQPAEEGPGGAEPMIQEGILKRFNIEQMIGLHVFPEVKEGMIACRPGPMMAQTGEFDIRIIGQSGHGAIPHKANDAIVIASNMITSLQSIISRNIDPIEGAVLTVGKISGGERRNIIAGETALEGTLRAFNENTFRRVKERVVEIAKGLELSYQCKIDIVFRDMYPAVVNDEYLYKKLLAAVGEENVHIIQPQMIAEDFSYYQKEIPGLFFFLGVRNEDLGHIYPLHSCYFTYNLEILIIGIQAYVNLARSLGGLK